MSATRWERTIPARVRYRLWSWLLRHPRACPASSHSLVVWGISERPWIDEMCKSDCARNGSCWCGKLREESA
jgi:hypothetical protein